MFKVIFPNTTVITPFWTLIVASMVAKKGLPKMIGIWTLVFNTGSVSIQINSTGKIKLSTLTRTSSKILSGYFVDLLGNYNIICIGLSSPKPICW